ncbi:MAG: hypothetical protein FJ096_06170 [Deltaproteobacteria bacterium]|nr:hypothetical protein [Deltaproteobacteria bacterium]
MNSKIVWLLGAVSATAMVGSTACIIVDDSGGAGGAGGAGGDGTTVTTDTTTTSDAGVTTSTGGGMCISCSEFLTGGNPDDLCADSKPLAEAAVGCVCDACVAECGAACDSTAMACDSCLQAAAGDQCKTEANACANDT